MVLANNGVLPHIEGFSTDERIVMVDGLSAFTHGNFHEAVDVFVDFNTLEGILKLFIGEIDELLEVIEKNSNDRTNLVAELGDLFHFWNDLFQLSEASVASLLISLDIAASNEMTVAGMKDAAAKRHDEELVAKDLLYELKVALRLGESDEIDAKLIGVMASHIFAVAVALDINAIYAVLMKNLRNRKKYDPVQMNHLYEDGKGMGYAAIRDKMVEKWHNGLGGDPKFFGEFLAEYPIELSYVLASQLATEPN